MPKRKSYEALEDLNPLIVNTEIQIITDMQEKLNIIKQIPEKAINELGIDYKREVNKIKDVLIRVLGKLTEEIKYPEEIKLNVNINEVILQILYGLEASDIYDTYIRLNFKLKEKYFPTTDEFEEYKRDIFKDRLDIVKLFEKLYIFSTYYLAKYKTRNNTDLKIKIQRFESNDDDAIMEDLTNKIQGLKVNSPFDDTDIKSVYNCFLSLYNMINDDI
jgi:hypothetical protein